MGENTSRQQRITVAYGSSSSNSSSNPACRTRGLGSRNAHGRQCSLEHCPAAPARMTSRSEAAPTILHCAPLTRPRSTLEQRTQLKKCGLQVIVKGVIYTKLELIGRGGSSKVYKVG